MRKRLHLFEGYGVEIEYMIADTATLDVRPIADKILVNESGEIEGEKDCGLTAWSNELVSHVLELKSNGPQSDLVGLRDKLVSDVKSINDQLKAHNAQLLPGAAHPWMNPATDTKLWEHENQEIYHQYDKIFNCKGHGWSNLQSTHINLPFYDDEEFARLHAAIRFLMPLIPALTASSPVLDGKFTGYLDKRLYYYEKNQASVPVITGRVIPEKLLNKHQYQKQVYDKIAAAIEPLDPQKILEPVWLNSRGAIARFDRGAIEIRIIDNQECVSADMANVALITTLVKMLVKERMVTFDDQLNTNTEVLYQIFKATIKHGSNVMIDQVDYLNKWNLDTTLSGREFWKKLLEQAVSYSGDQFDVWMPYLKHTITYGTLSERIVGALGEDYSRKNLQATYQKLADCLHTDTNF